MNLFFIKSWRFHLVVSSTFTAQNMLFMVQYKNGALRVSIFESALYRTTATVAETPDLVLVADPNWLPKEVAEIQQFVAEIRQGRPLFLLFTHSDYDHIIGYRAFAGAAAIASQSFVENPGKAAILEQILQFDDDYYISRDYPIEYPSADYLVQTDGQVLEMGSTKITFYLAPGHNRDGIFTLIETQGSQAVWLAGDYLSNIEFPYIYHSFKDYEQTLAKTAGILSKHAIWMMVTGHGDPAFSAQEILTRKSQSLDYISQLRQHAAGLKAFDAEKHWAQFRFHRSMKKFHDDNLALLEKELGNL
jgi:glyoxylase-like metal-dependent hydrolase (beta-lactamase superfamily II)